MYFDAEEVELSTRAVMMSVLLYLYAEALRTGNPGIAEGSEAEGIIQDNAVRIFVALFAYDPASMSPNPDAAEEELPFKEGQIIKVKKCIAVLSFLCIYFLNVVHSYISLLTVKHDNMYTVNKCSCLTTREWRQSENLWYDNVT